MEKVDVVIIGAGIVGLSVARAVSRVKDAVYVLERHESFGQETSSRNSEVLHAGIYYPPDSLKTRMCIQGNRLTYELCEKHAIAYKRTGKLIVATDSAEIPDLEKLFANAKANGVQGLELLSKTKAKELELHINAEAAILSLSTGIVDTHKLMEYFEYEAMQNGASITYKTEVQGIKKAADGYEITVIDASNEEFSFVAEAVINCAGLCSDSIAAMVGMDSDALGYRLKYCKGQYFTLSAAKSKRIARLIYPVPVPQSGGLGIHSCPNLAGIVRLGPDAHYIEREMVEYSVDEGAKKDFFESAVKFLPFIEQDDLIPDTAGIRPKLQGPDEAFRDFVIQEETDKGFPGFVNCIGIESPGLTAAPAIAELVTQQLRIS
ncbi:NAD(P)/FAD-dependent oxidoreductase [Candidatus Omnitrophota bacterium]